MFLSPVKAVVDARTAAAAAAPAALSAAAASGHRRRAAATRRERVADFLCFLANRPAGRVLDLHDDGPSQRPRLPPPRARSR